MWKHNNSGNHILIERDDFIIIVYIFFCHSGIDVQAALQKIGANPNISESTVATEASTFVVAYACHKVFVPVRMFMTITCTPLIVRRLRIMGLIKHPVKQ